MQYRIFIPASLVILALGVHVATAGPVLVTTGQTVAGTTTNITLNAGSITPNPNGNTSLSNVGSNLLVSLSDPNPSSTVVGDNDFYMTWLGAGDGLGFSTETYTYVQIDVAAISPGMADANWQIFWQDDHRRRQQQRAEHCWRCF